MPALLAAAHASKERVQCLCCAGRPDMYVARAGGGHIVKRMPYSGPAHAPDCISHRPATHDGAEPGRQTPRSDVHGACGSLRRLRELWSLAGLDEWRDSFEGKRPWAVVRSRLLAAAARMQPASAVFVPEHFRVGDADAIEVRRRQRWSALARSATPTFFIGELKRVERRADTTHFVVRHLPAQWLAVEEPAASNLPSTSNLDNDERPVVAGDLHLAQGRPPTLRALITMAVTRRWLPIPRCDRGGEA